MDSSEDDTDRKKRIDALQASITYSPRYTDDNNVYEYRWVKVPREVLIQFLSNHRRGALLSEAEWRALGLRMSRGWEHIDFFGSDQLTWVFRRRLDRETKTSSS